MSGLRELLGALLIGTPFLVGASVAPDRACALAVLAMTNTLTSGDLDVAVVNGLRQLSDSAGHPSSKRH